MTSIGLRLAVLSLALGLAAVNTGNNLLYLMLSLVVGLAVVCLVAAWWSLRRIQVTPLLPEEAVCGEPFLVGVEVRGRFPFLPQTWVQVRVEGLPSPLEIPVAVPVDEGHAVASSRATVDRRGLFEELSISAATGYPLDLMLRRKRMAWRGSLAVLPRFRRLREVRVGGSGSRGGGIEGLSKRRSGAGAELHNIREYTPHDDARHIDWRSSARTGRAMVREFEREEERCIDLVLDREAADAQAFEEVIERCAALLDLARRKDLDARLILPGLGAPLTGRAAMRYLAGATPVSPCDGGAQGRRLLEVALSQARGGAELVVLSTDPARATPLQVF